MTLYRYADKLPEWIEKFRNEGLNDTQIEEILKGKSDKYIGKWGNNSNVGHLINTYDNARRVGNEDLVMKPRHHGATSKHQALSPQAKLSSLPALEKRNSALPGRRTKSKDVRAKVGQVRNSTKNPDGYTTLDYEHFRTTNQSYHDILE